MAQPKQNRRILALALGGLFVVYALFSSRGVFSRVSLEVEKRKLQESIGAAREQQDSLKKMVKQLDNDTLLIEKIARERYGMIRQGESVYRIESPKK